jgi:Concanavalin A-like lectin/glucanases superfamily/Bacterial Ig-like domain
MRKIIIVSISILLISVSCLNDLFTDNTLDTLSVISTFPLSDAEKVDCTISIKAKFNEPVNETSVFSNTFIMKTGESIVSGSFSYDSVNYEIIFKPNEELLPSTNYQITIKKRIKSIDGASLPEDYTFHFETESMDISSDLVSFYKFDGNFLDASENNNTATGIGGLFVANRFAKSNAAYNLDNHVDYIEIPRLFNVRDSEWSYSVWFKLSKLPSQKGDAFLLTRKNLDYSSDIYLYVDDNDNAIKVAIYDGHYKMSSGITVSLDTWYCASVTNSEENISLFVNGEFTISSSKQFVDNLSSSEPFNLSSQYHDSWGDDPASTGSVIGTVDDIRIYNRCLNKKEINVLFNQESETSLKTIKLGEKILSAEIQNSSTENWP